jgi:hypothetical protein
MVNSNNLDKIFWAKRYKIVRVIKALERLKMDPTEIRLAVENGRIRNLWGIGPVKSALIAKHLGIRYWSDPRPTHSRIKYAYY